MKIFFTIILFFLLNSQLFNQTYFHFPENNAIWIISAQLEAEDGCAQLYDYQITGDTVINLLT